MTATDGFRPLEGMTVLDFSQVVAGPLSAVILADYGARVIKIEPPNGDASRKLGSRPERDYAGMFETFNRNKETIALDLKDPEHLQVALDMIDGADVLVESSRVGVMDRLGLGAEEMRARNPRLVYVTISGYGERGPNAQRGGVDVAIQAESGWMAITGEPDGPPTKLGAVPIDAACGHVAAQATLGALLKRERTGQGDVVRVSLYDVAVHLHAHNFTDYLTMGWNAKRAGNFPAATTPSGVYETSDGMVVLSAYMPHHWDVAMEVLGDEDLRNDPRFATMRDRMENRDELLPALQKILKTRTTDEWMEALEAARITCGVVRDVAGVVDSEQFEAAELKITMSREDGREISAIRTPARFDGFQPPVPKAAPHLNESENVLPIGQGSQI